jgi:Transglutaminase-like superfamily
MPQLNPVSPAHLARLGLVARMRLAVEILWAYARVRWLLRRADAERALELLRARRRSPALGAEQALVTGWRLGHAVNRTLAPLPTDARCLNRALSLLVLLERRGIDSTLVLAVRPDPFAAHAWIEVQGQALLPVADPGYERLAEL